MFRYRIKAKIILAISLMVIVTFCTICLMSLFSMKELAEYSIKSSSTLSKAAIEDSKKALMHKSKNEILGLAIDQAAISNLMLERIAGEIDNISRVYPYIRALPPDLNDANRILMNSITNAGRLGEGMEKKSFSYFTAVTDLDKDKLNKEMAVLSQMHNVFKFTFANNRHLQFVYMGTASGVFLEYPWDPLPSSYDPRVRPWYTNALEQDKIVWTGPYVSAGSNDLVITCSRAVYGNAKEVLGVVAADVKVDVISRDFISTQLQSGGYAFLVDESGNVLAREGLNDGHLKWNNDYRKENLFKTNIKSLEELAAEMVKGRSGVRKCKIAEGNEVYISYAPVKTTGWSIGIVMPVSTVIESALRTEAVIRADAEKTESYMLKYIEEKKIIFFCTGFIILSVIFLIGFVISNKITNPILALQRAVGKMGRGELDEPINIKTGDEIEELADSYNKMCADLKLYILNLQKATAEREHIEGELKVARRIQFSMLPRKFPPFPDKHEISIFACMYPAREVGGDFYDFFFIAPEKLFFCIGDVSGKGIPSALFMATTITLIKASAVSGLPLDEILLRANNILENNNEDCMFATVICGILDISTGNIVYCNAGHNTPLISRQHGFEYLTGLNHAIVIGPMKQPEGVFKLGECKLAPGESLFLYTDGVTEAVNSEKQLFTEQKLLSVTNLLKNNTPAEIVNGVKDEVFIHTGSEPQFDDITMLIIKYNGTKNEVV